ncbi:hypothetical protein [Streptomyces sp. RFCAC02]|uniref:hypothetical protein n=1 Tax=Streptomyces sp. RFCAC02 TaxID=2499143 RepID=UPI0010221F2F|nr:hypothetical protein [Streptomyces sp. RFCAC02]
MRWSTDGRTGGVMEQYQGFTEQDVRSALAAEGGPDAWETGPAFLQEIDPDHMAENAVVYAKAARETDDAAGLSRRASVAAGSAGGSNGLSFADAEDRLEETERDLAGGEDNGLYDVVEVLRAAMADAVDTRSAVDDLLNGEEGLHPVIQRRIKAAGLEWDMAVCRIDMPEGMADSIRSRNLRLAVNDARVIAGDIGDTIDSYRRRMTWRASELAAGGYDVADGPLGLWTTEGNAAYVAGVVREELARAADDPASVDVARLLDSMAQLRSIVDRGRDLAGVRLEDYAYLDAFYEAVGGGEAFVDLGAILQKRDDLGLDPTASERLDQVAAALGDGMLTAYGHDTVTMPDSLAHLFKVYSWRDEGGAWRDFGKFGEVLGHATTTPTRRMTEDLVSSAVVGIRSQHDNTGSDGVLHAAMLNLPVAREEIGAWNNDWADRKLEAREKDED